MAKFSLTSKTTVGKLKEVEEIKDISAVSTNKSEKAVKACPFHSKPIFPVPEGSN